MDLVVVGLSHKTAPVEQREKAALTAPGDRTVLRDLLHGQEVSEAVALSTCNRTELYAVGHDRTATEEALLGALVAHSEIRRPELDCVRYVHHGERAAAHLFRVASSLDSMVIGESEIQGQVRAAWQVAAEEGAVGPLLNHLFRQALEVGKRVRRETRIGQGPTSVSSVAVELARQAFDDLPGRHVLLIGAGQMAEATARALVDHGVGGVVVVNRTVGTARHLAERFGGRGVGFDRIAEELGVADIVISSTDAPHVILTRADLAGVMAERPGRPMVMVDIAVPRDLDHAIGTVPGVTLSDIDDLERVVEANLNGRRMEAVRGEAVVADALRDFAEWRGSLAVAPTIHRLRDRAEAIRQSELDRMASQWESMSDADRDRVNALTRSIVQKLLHEPTVRVRAAARSGDGLAHLESLRHLFDLEAPDGP
jgi:glutamyl-tRNA reductase